MLVWCLSLWRHSKILAALTYSPPQHEFWFFIFSCLMLELNFGVWFGLWEPITEGNDCGRLKLIFGCGFYLDQFGENFVVVWVPGRIWVFCMKDCLKLGKWFLGFLCMIDQMRGGFVLCLGWGCCSAEWGWKWSWFFGYGRMMYRVGFWVLIFGFVVVDFGAHPPHKGGRFSLFGDCSKPKKRESRSRS